MSPRRLSSLILSLILAATLACQGQDPTPATVDRQLAALDAEFAVAYENRIGKEFRLRTQDLDLKYSLALKRALDAATQAGQLDEALAIREERKRFDERSLVPAADGPADPAPVTQLRSTYRAQLLKIDAERERAAAPLYAEHDAKMEAYQSQLTKEGKLDDALKVKAARAKTAEAGVPQKASSPAPPEEGGWQVVFDHGSLDLWRPNGSSRNFQMVDGALFARRNTDEADYLYFKGSPSLPEKLKNFELRARVRADAEANSGFYFHLNGRETLRGNPASGVEVSLHNGAKSVKFPTGSLYDLTPMDAASLDQSEWFEVHFKVVDRIVTVLLNGQPYLEHLVAASPGENQKGIQAEGGRLAIQANSRDGGYYFEKIEIRPLP